MTINLSFHFFRSNIFPIQNRCIDYNLYRAPIINNMEQLRKKFPYFFLFIILLIMAFIFFSFVKLLLIDIQPWSQISTTIFIVVYLLVFILLLWSIFQAIRRDPGKVPLQWGFSLESQARKYCLICHVFKPQRTHHCSACGRCILNMDHHCPWINSCIGFHNRKPFILMLIYTCLATFMNLLAFVFSIGAIIDIFKSPEALKIVETVVVCVAFIINTIIFFTIANFLKFHLRLIFYNQTTIETLQLSRQGKNPEESESIYDIGNYYNWVQVFGTSSWTWFLPFFLDNKGPAGDGVIWPKRPASRSIQS